MVPWFTARLGQGILFSGVFAALVMCQIKHILNVPSAVAQSANAGSCVSSHLSLPLWLLISPLFFVWSPIPNAGFLRPRTNDMQTCMARAIFVWVFHLVPNTFVAQHQKFVALRFVLSAAATTPAGCPAGLPKLAHGGKASRANRASCSSAERNLCRGDTSYCHGGVAAPQLVLQIGSHLFPLAQCRHVNVCEIIPSCALF